MSDWYSTSGSEADVVLSTRARLSRNISGHLYPGSMGIDEEAEVLRQLKQVFEEIPGDRYECISLSEIAPIERRILLEKKMISQDFCLNKDKTLVLSRDGNFSGMINGEDHLRMSRFNGGLALDEVLLDLIELDRELEELIDFNASFDLGYLGPDLDNLGTALKMSVMLHLPALEATGLIDKALKTVLQSGMRVAGFSGESDQSLGQFYIISNRDSLGVDEKEISEKLENIARQLITYEKMAREDLVKRKMIELEDRVFRGKGVLENCRLLSRNEGVELTAALRLGRVLGLNDWGYEKLNALLVLGQDSHIKKRVMKRDETPDETAVARERADFFRDFLRGKDTQGGTA